MIQNCAEQILNDVVRIDFVPASRCDMEVPFQVSGITSMSGTKTVSGQTVSRIGTPVLSLAYTSQEGDEGEIERAPTLKQTEKRMTAGIVVNYDLQVPLSAGFQDVRIAVNSLQDKDFHMVFTTQEGTQYICYTVPEASGIALEEQGIDSDTTVKVTAQSMNHVILLT